MKKNTQIIFGAPKIEDDEIEEIVSVIKSKWIGTGPRVDKFEDMFRKYKKAKFVTAVNSCTAALHLSLIAARLEPGDEVITTPLTFCATINAIIHAHCTPVLADVDLKTMNISPECIEKKITSRTRAILPVHFSGRPCDMDKIVQISKKNSLKIIEDCAHAIEAEYKGQPTGLFGDFGCFSFYVTKNITTGEGGMVIARNENDMERIKIMALHGMKKDAWKRFGDKGYEHYSIVECGYKYNMIDLQAAIGIHQLMRIEKYWQGRKLLWDIYNESFADLPLQLPVDPEIDTKHAYHLYTILLNPEITGIDRDEFIKKMSGKKIGTGVHYLSIPEHPYYQQRFGWKPEDYPNAMQIGRQTVSLPFSASLENSDIDNIICAVKQIIHK
ncbi:pyridoxal phosphate-dependent aminotransferase [Candidatus Magnetomorum sp. HK-1]|nr:pyridoxal phosphate-dependent aminotransferase [Candidatus Magnetomorum sp. HK-1]